MGPSASWRARGASLILRARRRGLQAQLDQLSVGLAIRERFCALGLLAPLGFLLLMSLPAALLWAGTRWAPESAHWIQGAMLAGFALGAGALRWALIRARRRAPRKPFLTARPSEEMPRLQEAIHALDARIQALGLSEELGSEIKTRSSRLRL